MSQDKRDWMLPIFGLAVGVTVTAVRLTHPDMTETQLFLEFWWLWVAITAVGAVTYFAKAALNQRGAQRTGGDDE